MLRYFSRGFAFPQRFQPFHSEAALNAMVQFTHIYPTITESVVVVPLFSRLPLSAPKTLESSQGDYRYVLSYLCRLCVAPFLYESFLIRALSRLQSILSIDISSMTGEQVEWTVRYAHHLLLTVRTVMKRKKEKGHGDISKGGQKVVEKLMSMWLSPISKGEKGLWDDQKLIVVVGDVLEIVINQMDERLVSPCSLETP
jgi:DNA repair/transcription protein MET18/MMS19